jgi:UDP-glucuronate 4-epimerase
LIQRIPTGNDEWAGNKPDPATSFAPYQIFNIGNNNPVELLYFIEVLESKLGKKAIKNFLPIQEGDVPATFADITALEAAINFKPATTIEDGIGRFVEWYKGYYKD